MRIRFSNLCVGFVLAITFAFSSQLVAQSSQFQYDDIVYQLPDRWKKGKTNPDHTVIYRSDSGLKSICIFRSEDVPRSIADWMTTKIEILMEDDEREDTTDIPSTTIPAGRSSVTIGGAISGRKAWLAVANIGEQKANVVVMKSRIPRNEKGLTEFSKIMKKEFLPFALSLKFISQGTKPVLGDPAEGILDGTFSGLKYTHKLDMSTSTRQEFYTFSRSGRFLRGLPKGTSVEKIDFEKKLRDFPNRAGNYHIRGDKIHFEFADGAVSIKEFELTNKGFKLNQHYSRVNVPQDGTRFDGLYHDLNYSGFTPGSGVSGGVVNERTLRFSKSGKFAATQFSGLFGNFENSTGDTTGGFNSRNRRPKNEGTYEVRDGTLLLTDSMGKESVCSLVQLGERLIYVDGKQYLKKK